MSFRNLLALSLLLFSTTVYSTPVCHKQLKVAIIDTGLNLNDYRFTEHLCISGHKNFVPNETIEDFHGHGTHIAGLIEKYAKNGNYCLLIYKYYKDSDPGLLNQTREIMSIQAAINEGADIVNFSGGGSNFNEDEFLLIKNNPQIIFVVAAGNDGQNLDIPGNEYYPASYSYFYKNVIPVESIGINGKRYPSSNYGKKIFIKEVGENVLSFLPNGKSGYMTGTSQATAVFSGKLIDKLSKTCEYHRK